MPADQGVRLDDHESTLPITQSRPQHQRQAICIRQRLGFHFMLLVEGKLLSKKQVLSRQGRSRPKCRPHESGQIKKNREDSRNESSHTPHDSGILPDGWSNWNVRGRYPSPARTPQTLHVFRTLHVTDEFLRITSPAFPCKFLKTLVIHTLKNLAAGVEARIASAQCSERKGCGNRS